MAITNASRLADFGSGIGTQGAIIQVDNAGQEVGIGTTNPNATLTVGNIGASGTSIYVHGDGRITGVLTATKFSGGWDGALSITDSTASTSTSTGALIVSGGVGIAKSLFVGEGISVGGTITYDDVTNVDSIGIVTAGKGLRATTGGLIVTGVSTLGSDAEINGITVGRGGGNVASNIAFGVNALQATSTGSNNTAIGQNTLYNHTSGSDNIALGYHALYDITDGNYNIAIGRRTGQDITGNYNTAVGTGSLYSGIGVTGNTVAGYEAGYNLAGDKNVAIGFQAGYYVTGENNTILGGWKANESFSDTVLISAGETERMRITNNAGFLLSNGILVERCKVHSSTWGGSAAIDLDDGNVHLNTAAISGGATTWVITSNNTLNVDLEVGDMTSLTLITLTNNTAKYGNAITIDGSSATISWVGGSAPTDGSGSGYDTYTFNIIKTAATPTWVVIGNQVKGS